MTSYNVFPPHYLHTSKQVSSAQALELLSSYLEATAADASRHPNALLTESGPISATSGSNTGLVLHNLMRVEAGLRGEHLGADLSFAKFGGEGLPDLQIGDDSQITLGAGTKRAIDLEGQGIDADMGEGGWQDRTEFEREQEVTGPELGERTHDTIVGMQDGGKVPSVERTKSSGDKEERKKRKKEKRQQEKRDQEAKKMAKAQAER